MSSIVGAFDFSRSVVATKAQLQKNIWSIWATRDRNVVHSCVTYGGAFVNTMYQKPQWPSSVIAFGSFVTRMSHNIFL